MLDYMGGSVGLSGDSPIGEQLFNTGEREGGDRNIWSMNSRKYNPPLCLRKSTTLLKPVNIFNPPPNSYIKYTQIQLFFIKTAFL